MSPLFLAMWLQLPLLIWCPWVLSEAPADEHERPRNG